MRSGVRLSERTDALCLRQLTPEVTCDPPSAIHFNSSRRSLAVCQRFFWFLREASLHGTIKCWRRHRLKR